MQKNFLSQLNDPWQHQFCNLTCIVNFITKKRYLIPPMHYSNKLTVSLLILQIHMFVPHLPLKKTLSHSLVFEFWNLPAVFDFKSPFLRFKNHSQDMLAPVSSSFSKSTSIALPNCTLNSVQNAFYIQPCF